MFIEINSSVMIHPLHKSNYKLGYTHGSPTFYSDFHLGEDYILPTGEPVHAPLSGSIKGVVHGEQGGLTIHLSNKNYYMRFMHLSEVTVEEGQQVEQGAVIAFTGGEEGDKNAGISTAPHLHFDVYDLSKGSFNYLERDHFVDPSDLINARTRDTNLKVYLAKRYYESLGIAPCRRHLDYEAKMVRERAEKSGKVNLETDKLIKLYKLKRGDYIKHHFNPQAYIWRYPDLRQAFGVRKLEDLEPQVEKQYREIVNHWLNYGVKEGRTDEYTLKKEKQ